MKGKGKKNYETRIVLESERDENKKRQKEREFDVSGEGGSGFHAQACITRGFAFALLMC